jgi:uncharacterized protein YfaS (alpha-2-macroglobulin family)
MNRNLLLALTITAGTATAQDFEGADKYLRESSFARACDGFTAFLKTNPSSPLVREATAKRGAACLKVGKGNFNDELKQLADKGEKDFGRAYANWALAERGERSFDSALVLMKQAAGGDDRAGKQAREMFVRGALTEMERNAWDRQKLNGLCEDVLSLASSANDKAHARLLRARANLQEAKTISAGEAELKDLGNGSTDFADDAIYELGQRRENDGKYSTALELYDGIVKRFSPTTSNVRESAQERAKEIRRSWITVSISWIELPGMKPQVSTSHRNVSNAHWTVRKLDPNALPKGSMDHANDEDFLAAPGPVVSQWDSKLAVSAPYAQGSSTFELNVTEPGAYAVEAVADGKHVAHSFALVTAQVTALKLDRRSAITFTADADTGKAAAGAEVALFVRDYQQSEHVEKLTQKADENGVARFDLQGFVRPEVTAWAKQGPNYSWARVSSGYSGSDNEERLAWVITDRPLYKPGETVGFKIFVRNRKDGPSVPVKGDTFNFYVRDASGRELAKPSLTTNEFGTAAFELKLGKGAQLGSYNFYLQAPSRSYQQGNNTFRVEEYKPPEYTVTVSPMGNPKPGEAAKFKVAASFFFGGPVANAQGRAVVSVRSWTHQWKPWPEDLAEEEHTPIRFLRHDYYRGYPQQLAQHTLQFKTGPDGTAEVEVPATKGIEENYPGITWEIRVFVTDASRREVQGQGSVNASKEPFFVDVRTDRVLYKPGEKVGLKLRAQDANGRPEGPELIARLVKLTDAGASGQIAEKKLKLENGIGTVSLDADALGPVRVEVRGAGAGPETPPLATAELWLTNDAKPMVPPNAGFQLLTDRGPLHSGQMLRVLVVTPLGGGHALLSLESDAIHFAKAFELNGRARFVEIPLTADMTPNCWLHVLRFEAVNELQTTVPVRVLGAENELDVKVKFDRDVTEPGSSSVASVSVTGNAPKGAASETAITFVDEALFALEPENTGFVDYFGRRQRPMTVQTASTMNQRSYRRPVDKNAQPSPTAMSPEEDVAMSKSEVASGAGPAREPPPAPAPPRSMAPPAMGAKKSLSMRDEESDNKESKAKSDQAGGFDAPVKVRSDFGTTAGWLAALAGKVGAPVQATAKLTDSLTTWRAIATVVTQGPHLGVGRATVRTERPLMVRLQAPRFFTERDEVTLSAIVTSRLPSTAEVDVAIAAPGLKPLGAPRQLLKVEPGKDVRFDVRFVVVDPGDLKVKAVAKGGGKADAMELTLPAVVHGSAQRVFFAGQLTDKFSFELQVPEKRKPALTRLELQLSPSLLAVMFDGLPYLASYPYGCVEQTLSRFVPAAIAAKAVKELGLPAIRVPENLDDMVQSGLKRLYGFQHSDGGWGWWQSDTTNKWMSAYAVYGLSLGQEAGLEIDGSVIQRGRSYLTQALGGALNDPETHAFMVFALAKTGGAPKPSLDSAFANRTRLSPRGRALVALAMLAQKDARARIAVENLDDIVKAAASRPDAAVGEANDIWSTSAAIEATAYTLMAMVKYDLKSPNIKPLTDFLVLRRNGGKWRTTRDTAFAIYALSELATKEAASSKSGTFVVLVNGKESKRISFTRGGLDLTEPIVLPDSAFKPGKNLIEVRRDGGATGYYAATFDVFNQNDFIKGVGGDVVVTRKYTLLGRPSAEKADAPTEYGMPVESGVRVRVDLEVKANKAVEFVMVEDLKAAGFETVLLKSGPEVCNYRCAHAELRTDRVAMFLQQIPVGITHLSYELRAEVPGKFAALPARVEAMYAPEITSTSDEMRFEVRDAADKPVAGR